MRPADDDPDEDLVVWRHRYQEARRAGFEHVQACEFAQSDVDVGELRRLVQAGCEPRLIARIVL